MTMSRISFVPVADWPEALRSFSGAEGARDIELGITRMLAHAPAAAMGHVNSVCHAAVLGARPRP